MMEPGSLRQNFRYVVTGAPGSGKTTLIEALQQKGYRGFPEIARNLINKGIAAPIWGEYPVSNGFFEAILQERIRAHGQTSDPEIGFYDRGLPDSVAYLKFMNRKVPEILTEAIGKYRYHNTVFAAPPWKEIYSTDSVRRETFPEAEKLYELGVGAYEDAGYRIVELPKLPVESRMSFILSEARLI